MIRIALPVYLCLLLLTTSPSSSAQGLSPSTPSKDYIRQGRSIIAIETPASVVQFAPVALSFGTVNVGSSASQTVTLTNGGTKAAPVTISAVALGGANPGSFGLVNGCGGTLAPKASCTVSVTFTPAAQASYAASVVVTDSAAGSPQSVTLSGVGIVPEPRVGVSPGSLGFGNQNVGSASGGQAVTVTNSGSAALAISSIAMGGANAGDFSATNNCGGSVAAGGSCTVTVTFSPTAQGSRTASLVVTDNTGGVAGSTQSVGLSGTGLEPVIGLSPTSVNLGSVNLGANASQTVTVSNSGNVVGAISSVTGSGDFSASTNCVGSVAAGGSCLITVTFTPTLGGSRTGTLTVTDNSGNVAGAVQTVGLSGTGVPVPGIQLTPTSITFPNTFPGNQSGYSTVTAKNTGSGTLTITSVGLNGDFVKGTNTCVGSLAPGGTCTVQVAFAPPNTGTFTANLIFTDNAGNVAGSQQTVALTGTSKCPTGGCQ